MKSRTALRTLRLGRISYVNTLPFYHNLPLHDLSSVEIKEGPPAQINALMNSNKIDIAPISSLEYALHQEKYRLLPKLCIGSRDFSRSVLLLSHERIEGLGGSKIVLTEKSLSSQALLKILLRFLYKFENHFVTSNAPVDEMLKQGKAVLTIGDDALFYKPSGFVFRYDLSELWWNWTAFPFCFSVWAVRREFAEAHPHVVETFYQILQSNTERNLQDLETLIRESLKLTIASDHFAAVFGYLFNLTYFIDEHMLKGLNLYYQLAEKAGIAHRVNQIDFMEFHT